MKMEKNTKGITLIALVVTIIVLIILATVSINLVLGDGGIIRQAEKAAEVQANAEKQDSQLLDSLSQRIDEMLNNGGGSQEDDDEVVPELLRQYILGEEEEGILATSIFDMETMKFKGEETVIPNAEEELKLMDAMKTTTGMYVLFGYENQAYVAEVGTNYYTKDLYVGVNKIWEGEQQVVEVGQDTHGWPAFSKLSDSTSGTQLNGLSGKINKTKMYAIHFSLDGSDKILLTQSLVNLGWYRSTEPMVIAYDFNTYFGIVLKENGKVCTIMPSSPTSTIVVKEIYEVKSFVNYAESNGFAVRRDMDAWEICKTPNTSYNVPQVLGIYPITMADLGAMTGTPNFTTTIDVTVGEGCEFDNVVITAADDEFVNNLLGSMRDSRIPTKCYRYYRLNSL